jgi:prepilin-type N-terminal cleavage/methylation domain-containing protein
MENRSSNRGFTLIEAAVAIAVVAILSGIIVPLVLKNIKDSQVARAKNDVQVIAAAIAAQIKDTGVRPSVAGGPGGATGAQANTTWYSGPALGAYPAAIAGTLPFTGANTLTNLFTAPNGALTVALGNTLFATVTGAEFSYNGPYLGADVCAKTDPWGNPYIIVGYNATQQAANGPIWVVCAGPDKGILAANAVAIPPAIWNQTVATGGVSQDDIVVRVN